MTFRDHTGFNFIKCLTCPFKIITTLVAQSMVMFIQIIYALYGQAIDSDCPGSLSVS